MSEENIDVSVAKTQAKITALQKVTPESLAQKASVSRYLASAKAGLAELVKLQQSLENTSSIPKSDVLKEQISEIKEILRKASEVLFKELNTKLVNDAAIDVLEKTLYGLDVLYASLYAED